MSISSVERFWRKVNKTDGCWIWTAARQRRGYGAFWTPEKIYPAHRWIYQVLNGPISLDLQVCHHCDNPPCVRPDHLFVGTRRDNMLDCARKGRRGMQPHPANSQFRNRRTIQCRGEDQGNAKLTTAQVLEMRQLANEGATAAAVARKFSINAGHVRRIIARKAWTHV